MTDPTEQQLRDPERPPATGPPAAGPPAPAPRPRWTAGRVVMLVLGSVLALIGLPAIATGGYGLWLHTTQRSDGYVMTSSERFATRDYALATRTLHLSSDVPSFLYGRDWLGHVRIRGESENPARALFIGIGPKADVDRYLAGVGHSDVTDVSSNAFGSSYRPTYAARPGGAPPGPPARQRFWVAQTSGPGTQALTWSVKAGRWSVVVMRPDASRGVSANLAAGAKLPALLWVSITLLAVGLLLLAGGAALIWFGGRERRAPGPPPPPSWAPPSG